MRNIAIIAAVCAAIALTGCSDKVKGFSGPVSFETDNGTFGYTPKPPPPPPIVVAQPVVAPPAPLLPVKTLEK